MYDYAMRFEQDDYLGYAIFCRDLPQLNSYGENLEHAIRESVDALETTLSLYVDQRLPIPEATAPHENERVIRLSAVTIAKIALWNKMMSLGMRKSDLCKELKISQTQGDRLVDFLHTSKMEQLEKALEALNTAVRVSPLDDEWIDLPHGGGQAGFYIGRLVDELLTRPDQQMPIGATKSNLDQVKPGSLDYFLRSRYAKNPNTMQAVQSVIEAIVDTGKFEHLPRAPGQPAGVLRLK